MINLKRTALVASHRRGLMGLKKSRLADLLAEARADNDMLSAAHGEAQKNLIYRTQERDALNAQMVSAGGIIASQDATINSLRAAAPEPQLAKARRRSRR